MFAEEKEILSSLNRTLENSWKYNLLTDIISKQFDAIFEFVKLIRKFAETDNLTAVCTIIC